MRQTSEEAAGDPSWRHSRWENKNLSLGQPAHWQGIKIQRVHLIKI